MPDGHSNRASVLPKLITTFSEGYNLDKFRKDFLAALTVAIVALPLSMAFAIASGVSPERGLYTSIVGASWSQHWVEVASRLAVRRVPLSS